jgi:ferric-dicitrate binding protein FerR (iron transport regulator)
MMDDASLSRSISAYVDTFGEPDHETTSRMRKRLTDFVEAEEGRRRRRRTTLVWVAVGVALLGVGSFAAARLGFVGGSGPAQISGGASGQTVEIPGHGRLELAPGAQLRIEGDLAAGGALELGAGSAQLDLPKGAAVRLRSGGYELELEDARVVVRHTDSLPVVDVLRGRVRLFGPDLPLSGVWLGAGGDEKNR